MDWTPEKIAEVLNRLPMVAWDRGIRAPVGADDDMVIIYGWIQRDDGHYDYVEISFASWSDVVGSSTSSARYSRTINTLLHGHDAEHNPCVRIADILDLAPLVDRVVPWAARTE